MATAATRTAARGNGRPAAKATDAAKAKPAVKAREAPKAADAVKAKDAKPKAHATTGATTAVATTKSASTAKPPAHRWPTRATFRATATMLKLTSDGTRLELLCRLAGGGMNVTQMRDLLGMSQANVSHHLQICRHAGLFDVSRAGKFNIYTLTPKGKALAECTRGLLAV